MSELHRHSCKVRCLRLWRIRVLEKDAIRERLLKAIVKRRCAREVETETSASSGFEGERNLGNQMRSLIACSTSKGDWELSDGLSSFPMLSSPRAKMSNSSPFNSVFNLRSEGTNFVSAVSERFSEPVETPAPVCVSLATATICYLAATASSGKDRTNLQWRRVLIDMRDTNPLDAPIDIRGFVRLAAMSNWGVEMEFLARVFVNYLRSARFLKWMRAGLSQGARRRRRCREMAHVLRLQMASRWLIIWRFILESETTRHLCNLKTVHSRKALRLIPRWHRLALAKVDRREEAILLHVHQQMENGRESLRQWRSIVRSITSSKERAQSIAKRWQQYLVKLTSHRHTSTLAGANSSLVVALPSSAAARATKARSYLQRYSSANPLHRCETKDACETPSPTRCLSTHQTSATQTISSSFQEPFNQTEILHTLENRR